MAALFPPALFVLAVVLAITGADPPGATPTPPFDEALLLWTLYFSVGWAGIGAGISHTLFAKSTAKSIGWVTNNFQYEVGFADFARGLGAIYAVHSGSTDAFVTAAIIGGVFTLLAGFNHIRGMRTERNFAPGNSLILIANFGPPVVLLVTLLSTGSI